VSRDHGAALPGLCVRGSKGVWEGGGTMEGLRCLAYGEGMREERGFAAGVSRVTVVRGPGRK
jgi:hypothetical protein